VKKYTILAIVIFSLCFTNIFAQNNEKGITTDIPSNIIYKVSGQLDPVQIIPIKNILDPSIRGITQTGITGEFEVSGTLGLASSDMNITPQESKNLALTDYSGWILTDSVFLYSFIQAGKNLGVKINIKNRKLEIISPNTLSTEAQQAVAKSPKWIRQELINTLSGLSQNRQNEFAEIINNAAENLIDEIAFSIAYSSSAFLNSSYCFPQLFLENAQLIYKHDSDLNYVQIVDYGTPSKDEDYYSTVKYWKVDAVKGKIQIEVPKEIYYMYIVHPKITDEMQTYINPNLVETNYSGSHTNNIAAPPAGVFWRDYLYTHTEEKSGTVGEMYPILKDSVSACDVIWDDKNEQKQAVRAITNWINDVMDFTSKQERPHQPVRIYDLHIGRCGEYEDLTAAAARACLIPCRGIDASSIDHVWNEFWDEKWEQWEPVNNSFKSPLAYITWDTMGAVTARQSCGVHEYVTDTYNNNQNSKFTITALDANGKPIDGAVIKVYSNYYSEGQNYIIFDTYGISDNDGKCSFILGKNKFYYIRLESELGNNPLNNNQVLQINTTFSGVNMSYDYNISAPKSQSNTLTETTIPEDNLNDFMLKINLSVERQAINWKNLMNDLANETTYCKSEKEKDINLIIVDEENYNKFIAGQNYVAYRQITSNSELEFSIPAEKDWYVLLNNGMINNLQLSKAIFALYKDPNVGVVENLQQINKSFIYPSPAHDYINASSYFGCQYMIYDLLGICVQSGAIDSENINVGNLPTGFYTIQFFKVGEQKIIEKLMKE